MSRLYNDIERLSLFLKANKKLTETQNQEFDIRFSEEGMSPSLHLQNGETLSGLATIARYLVKAYGDVMLSGVSPEETARIAQWMEYRRAQLDTCPHSNYKDLYPILAVINDYLADKVYMVSRRLTLADIFLYYTIQRTYEHLSFYDKERLMHLSRWLDNVQHEPGLRRDIPFVTVQRNLLYGGMATTH